MWGEGNGWEREIWVTGAGDPDRKGGLGVEGARWAVCRLAGLVEDERGVEKVEEVVLEEKEVERPKIVPFDQIQWAVEEAVVKPVEEVVKPVEEKRTVRLPKKPKKKLIEEKPKVAIGGRITTMEDLQRMAMQKKSRRRFGSASF